MTSAHASMVLRAVLALLILFSITVTYYSKVLLQDFEVLTNPEGPDTSDYFE